ncbi:Outer membrane protein TolC [Cyclobacterium lianum]|jgi:outer membrane protein TolC|uniref:Outer membrane protein TolC n=1 Tax=Cyclobacterium lianum TaxID=388280 RepID=A0A1M7PV50_9BACT|nr:TolC family protein [Cyclobacterium lianum]SHN21443.1 Outer membrane protein TolC [Cyclobacterium lianum]
MKKNILIASLFFLSFFSANAQTYLTLEESKALALKNNKALQNSTLETEAAKQVKKNAYTNYFPKVSANILGFRAIDPLIEFNLPQGNLPIYDGNPANLPTATQFAYFPGIELSMFQRSAIGVLNISQPLYAGGQIRNGNRLASIGVDVKEMQQHLSENEVLIKTEEQYWQLISLQEKEKTLEKYELLLKGIRKQVDDAFKAGLIIKNDVLKVQIKQSELEANKNKLINGKKLATMQFCQTIGIPYDSTLVLQEKIDVSHHPNHYYVDNQNVLAQRVEYQLLEKSLEVADLQKKMKTGENLPTIAVGLAGYQINMLENGVDNITNGLAYVSVSIPISNWWGGSYTIKEQNINKRIAENNFEDTKGLLNLQMEKAWIDVNETWKQIEIMKETAMQAEENLKVSQTGYDSGVVSLSDLLEAQALVTETADKLTDAQTQYKLALTFYLQVTGQK